jgi:hypothetical protein
MPAESTAPAVPAVYVEDPPETPEVEATETEEQAETEAKAEETESEATEDEQGAEGEEEAAEEETEAEEEPEDEQPKGHNRDAGLTRLQQRQATFERQIGEQFTSLTEKLESLTAAISKQGGEATPKQEEKLEEVKDDLDELVEKLSDDDIVEGKALKSIVQKLAKRAASNKPATDPELASLKKELADFRAERQAEAEDRAFRQQFAKDYGPVHDRLDDLLAEARQEIEAMPIKLKGEAFAGAFNAAFYRLANAAMKEAKGAKPKPKVEARKTAAPKGVTTVKPGATTKPAAGATPSKVPLWMPD